MNGGVLKRRGGHLGRVLSALALIARHVLSGTVLTGSKQRPEVDEPGSSEVSCTPRGGNQSPSMLVHTYNLNTWETEAE